MGSINSSLTWDQTWAPALGAQSLSYWTTSEVSVEISRDNISESALRLVGDCPRGGPSQVALVIKNLPVNAGDAGVRDSVPGLGRSRGGGHGSPLQYPFLDNPVDRGAWWAVLHRVSEPDKSEVT